jgi:hypothetical protein
MKINNAQSRAIFHHILDGGADLPDVTGDFHLTVDGIPFCRVERALAGEPSSECQFASLNDAFADCLAVQSIFPAATVGVFLGKCPHQCASEAA